MENINAAKNTVKTINLYGESDGISILIDRFGDIALDGETSYLTRVIGHRLYACSLDEAHRSIQSAYWQCDARFARLSR